MKLKLVPAISETPKIFSNILFYLGLDHMISLTSNVLQVVEDFNVSFSLDSFQIYIHYTVSACSSNTSTTKKYQFVKLEFSQLAQKLQQKIL